MKTKKPILKYIPEPSLTFGYNQIAIDPRDGLMLYGPFEKNKLYGVKTIGIVGPIELHSKMVRYLNRLNQPFFNDDKSRPSFPGLNATFGITINPNIISISVSSEDLEKYKMYSDNHIRIYNWTELYYQAIKKYEKEESINVDVWFIVIPEYVYNYGRPLSKIPPSKYNITYKVPEYKRKEPANASLFEEFDLEDAKKREPYQFEKNFHNQLKAKLLPLKVKTQIIRQSKIESLFDPLLSEKELLLETAKAWNICTSLYYKLGGLPWKLGTVRPEVCYLGLVYKKTDDSKNANNACCAAQMFLDSGDGMVFRGNIGPWWNPETKEFHLKKEDAISLISRSLEAFKDKFNYYPKQIFIHSRTLFDDKEWEGFEEATKGKSQIVGIRIQEKVSLKLFRHHNYCIPRGMMLLINDKKAYLWTKGFIPRIKTQMGLEVPGPIEIIVSRGEENIETVCKDILSLTKLNYNACIYGDGIPVTLKFANSIGEILTAGKNENVGVLTFMYYI